MTPSQELQIVVPNKLLEDLAGLREDYARFLCEYMYVLESSPEGQKKFVDAVSWILEPDRSFQSYFNKVVDEEVSLFNITYLQNCCDIFPADVR